MKRAFSNIFLILFLSLPLLAQEANKKGKEQQSEKFTKELSDLEAQHKAKPTDPLLNFSLGEFLYKSGHDKQSAEMYLLNATTAKKPVAKAHLVLAQLYFDDCRFSKANEALDKYESLLKKTEEAEKPKIETLRKEIAQMARLINNTEDIQVIDSLVLDKKDLLQAYKMSLSSGHIDYFNQVFKANKTVESTVYFNELESKIYFSQPVKNGSYSLFSMEKIGSEFENEKKVSLNNFDLEGSLNYPFITPDGLTIYFASTDKSGLGGYDIYVTRYNLQTDVYLKPQRLNMPFNSSFNDYMMVVDEEKGVGWFASDRYQPEGKVCVYTFIPNASVKQIESTDEQYLANRARLTSIKDTWVKNKNYSSRVQLARKDPEKPTSEVRDFSFVIDDANTYYKLSDFKNKTARDTFFKVIQLRNELKTLSDNLEKDRSKYAKASLDEKRKMANSILTNERKEVQLLKELDVLELQARREEIQYSN